MDIRPEMAVSHRSHHEQDTRPLQPDRYRRRRRTTLWDVRTPTYQHTYQPPSQPPSIPPRHNVNHTRPTESKSWYVPRPNDVVYVPPPGETGPLAGINIPGLIALLRSSSSTPRNTAHPMNTTPGSATNQTTPTLSNPPIPLSAVPPSANPNINNITNNNPNSYVNKSKIPGISVSTTTADGIQSSDAAMQSTRHARRLYVGNLPADTTELQIGDFFNRALVASKGSESGDEPVISVYINLDKRFAFIETCTMREAVAGLCLDGVKFRSVSLRVRRPNDFIPSEVQSVRPPPGFDPAVLGIVSTQVSDGPNKMFIGGIPYSLNEDQVKGLLKSFGELAAFNLIKEATSGQSKGFAFFEYADSSVVEAACKELHGMQVGDKTLTVRRATQSSGGVANTGGGVTGGGTNGSTPGDIAPGATHASGLSRSNGNTALPPSKVTDLIFPSTSVVHLKDIISAYELKDEDTYNEIRKDIAKEANIFGKVEQMLIPRPSDDPPTVFAAGNVFLKYSDVEEAESAQVCFDGRKFEDRIVTAEFFDEKMFASREFNT